MGVLQDIRTILTSDPRAARSFVTGPVEVYADQAWWGTGSDYQPPEYVSYPATSNGVYACINARTKALSSLPIKLYSKRVGADGRRKEITSGPARDILDSINPFWTFQRWLDMTEQSLCVWGESFTFYGTRGGRPSELWWARADQVKVHPHPTEYISHFTLDTGNGKPIRFEREETLWLRFPNVANQWEGLSPLAAARLAADTSSAAMKSNFNIFRNGLTGAGMVSPKEGQNLTDEQAKAVAADLTRRFRGVDNAHKVAVLRFGVDIKQLSLTPKDAEFLGMMNWSLEDIARAYAVPIDKIGGKRTYQNVDDSEKVFWNDCILPEARFIAREITEQLLPLFGGDLVAEFDDSDIDVLHEAETAKWERWQGQLTTGVRTVNEYRAAEGLKPVPWGDDWWAQATLTPVGGPLADEKAAKAEEMAQQISGTVTQAGDDDEDETNPPALPPGEETERSRRARVIAFDSPEHRSRWQRQIDATEPWEERIRSVTVGLFLDQQQSVIAVLRRRGVRVAEELLLEPFDRSRWIKAFRVAFRPLAADAFEEFGGLALDELGLGLSFNVADPNVLSVLEQQVSRFAEGVNQTTWTAIREAIADGINERESIDQMVDRIQHVYSVRRGDAEAIARTEVTTAYNSSTLEGWRQSGVVTRKRWLAALDSRTRPTHRAAHGQEVGIDDVFTVGRGSGPCPGSMGIKDENLRCRCSMEAVLDVEG
jgi:HK97 family phage portal protein